MLKNLLDIGPWIPRTERGVTDMATIGITLVKFQPRKLLAGDYAPTVNEKQWSDVDLILPVARLSSWMWMRFQSQPWMSCGK